MNLVFYRMILLAGACLAAAGCGGEPVDDRDYFPLEPGRTWKLVNNRYDLTLSTAPVENSKPDEKVILLKGKSSVGRAIHWEVVMRKNVYVIRTRNGEEVARLQFPLEEGAEWDVPGDRLFGPMRARVMEPDDSTTRLGVYEDCKRIRFMRTAPRSALPGIGGYQIWLAKDVGIVEVDVLTRKGTDGPHMMTFVLEGYNVEAAGR